MVFDPYIVMAMIAFVVQVCVLRRLVSQIRKFYALFIYIVALILATVFEVSAYAIRNPELYRWGYWLDEAILDALVLLVLFSFISQALHGHPKRAKILLALAATAITVAGASAFFVKLSATRTMTDISRNWSFFTAIVNVVLWTILIRNRGVDRQLLMMSGAFGIQTTAQAITHSLHTLLNGPYTEWIPRTVPVLAHIMCLYLWWKALGEEGLANSPGGRSAPSRVVDREKANSS